MKIVTTMVCASFLVMASTTAFAQSNAEKAALDVVEKYWQARNDRDFETQVDLTSDNGTLDANSDGSFFRTSPKPSVEELEEQGGNGFEPEHVEALKAQLLGIEAASELGERRFHARGEVVRPQLPSDAIRVAVAVRAPISVEVVAVPEAPGGIETEPGSFGPPVIFE